MPSERVTQILRSKTTLSEAAIAELSESQAWQLVATVSRSRRKNERRFEVCFTGFRPDEKAELEQMAKDHGLKKVTAVTINLQILVVGDAPGPKKLEKAAAQGVTMMGRAEFVDYLASLESIDVDVN